MDTHYRAGPAVLLAAACCAGAIALAGCTSSGPAASTTSAGPPASAAQPTGAAQGTPPVTSEPGHEPGSASGNPAGVPLVGTLRITTPQPGQTITLPATIGYQVTGLTVDARAGYQLSVQAGTHTVELPISAATGTVRLPIDKLLAGTRDLTFRLIGPGLAAAPESVVVVRNVLITGPK